MEKAKPRQRLAFPPSLQNLSKNRAKIGTDLLVSVAESTLLWDPCFGTCVIQCRLTPTLEHGFGILDSARVWSPFCLEQAVKIDEAGVVFQLTIPDAPEACDLRPALTDPLAPWKSPGEFLWRDRVFPDDSCDCLFFFWKDGFESSQNWILGVARVLAFWLCDEDEQRNHCLCREFPIPTLDANDPLEKEAVHYPWLKELYQAAVLRGIQRALYMMAGQSIVNVVSETSPTSVKIVLSNR